MFRLPCLKDIETAMMHLLAFVGGITALSCKPISVPPETPFKISHFKASSPDIDSKLRQLEMKKSLYLRYAKVHENVFGWLDYGCDSLLFNSLYGYSGGNPNILAARSRDGTWHRTTNMFCYPKHSKSEISKDMLVGLLLYLYSKNDSKTLLELKTFGVKEKWFMGKGPYTRTLLMPDQRRNLANMIEDLTGKKHVDQGLPSGYALPCEGYSCHLKVIDFYTHHLIHGSLPLIAVKQLTGLVKRNPKNALFLAVLSIYNIKYLDPALHVLLDSKMFPMSRLPSAKEFCSDYVFQRSYLDEHRLSRDWKPCPERDKVHLGVDFLFASTIILKHFQMNVVAEK